MNKLLIVLLAVCLVSTHAFVRRDAPAPAENDNPIKKFGETMNNFGQTISQELGKVFNPDTMKQNFNEFVDNVSKKVDEFKAKPSAS